MATGTNGNCYLCGATFGKGTIKNHLLKTHDQKGGEHECILLKIEGADSKDHWLFIEVPKSDEMQDIDYFLRKIWLECCGHMSAFCYEPWNEDMEIDMEQKAGSLTVGEKFFHIYDFGSTTKTIVTVAGITRRIKPLKGVRLLARNVPLSYECSKCGKPATHLCHWYDFFCADCSEEFDEEEEGYLLPVTNSPRMGECAYFGEKDKFAFDPAAFDKAAR